MFGDEEEQLFQRYLPNLKREVPELVEGNPIDVSSNVETSERRKHKSSADAVGTRKKPRSLHPKGCDSLDATS